MAKENTYTLSDNVIARIAQILQEGILLGVDIVDLLRQAEVTPSFEGQSLVLTEDYAHKVAEMHKKLVAEAEAMQKKTGIELS